MSTTVTFAGHLVDDPELLYTHENKPFVTCRVLVNHRTRHESGWADDEPTPHNVKVYGTAALNLYDSAGRGDRVLVHGLMRTETWTDKTTKEKRTKQVVEMSNRFGEVGASFRHSAARIERQRPTPSAESAVATPPVATPPASGALAPGAEFSSTAD